MQLGQIRKPEPNEDLNLIPIMNLFVAMIPFLLMSAAFFHLSVVNASVPTVAEDDTVISIDRKKVNMTLQVSPKGLKLSGGNETMTQEQMDQLKRFFPKRKDYNYEALAKMLLRIKQKYPKSDTLVLVPTNSISFQTIVKVMDTARAMKPAVEGQKGKELFPNVVLSSVVD